MARTLLCEIVTPEAILYTNEVQMVVATTSQGEIGILPLHTAAVTTLAPGEVRLRFGDNSTDWEFFSIAGGYLQVHEDKVIILADRAVSISQIDAARAKDSADLITARLSELPPEAADERAQMVRDLDWAQTQLRVAERRGK